MDPCISTFRPNVDFLSHCGVTQSVRGTTLRRTTLPNIFVQTFLDFWSISVRFSVYLERSSLIWDSFLLVFALISRPPNQSISLASRLYSYDHVYKICRPFDVRFPPIWLQFGPLGLRLQWQPFGGHWADWRWAVGCYAGGCFIDGCKAD